MNDTPDDQKLSRLALVALVVGSMVGAGIFTLPAAFAASTGVAGALIAWAIAGGGMLMLAFVFQTLSRRKPEIDAGIYGYAKAGFGNYPGFLAAFGYWIACCLADVACLILIKATLGQFFPVFGDGSTAVAILDRQHHRLDRPQPRAARHPEAAMLNTIATFAKMIPIGIFIIVVIAGFNADIFAANFWGGEAPTLSNVASQVRNTMLVTVFVFVGIEGASVYSRYAKNRDDVGVATVLGFLGVLCLLVLVTVFSYGILLRPELAALATPSMAGVMEAIVGPWGRVFISIGLLISIAGNYLSWSLLAAEVLHSAAQNDTLAQVPGARECQGGAIDGAVADQRRHPALPARHLVRRIRLHPGAEDDQRDDAAALSAGRGLCLQAGVRAARPMQGEAALRRRDRIRAGIATLYAAAMLLAGGAKFLALAALLYAPGSWLFWRARREQGETLFTGRESLVFGVIVVAALLGLAGLVTGAIAI